MGERPFAKLNTAETLALRHLQAQKVAIEQQWGLVVSEIATRLGAPSESIKEVDLQTGEVFGPEPPED